MIDHALHNERAAIHLKEGGEFYDWVVITSFYAAYKFLEHVIFPYEVDRDGKPFFFTSMSRYWQRHKSKGSVHSQFFEMICESTKIDDDSKDAYMILRGERTRVQYDGYARCGIRQAEAAMENLRIIKACCEKAKPIPLQKSRSSESDTKTGSAEAQD